MAIPNTSTIKYDPYRFMTFLSNIVLLNSIVNINIEYSPKYTFNLLLNQL